MIGQKFYKLTVVSKDTRKGFWLCSCDCGGNTYATGPALRNGTRKSCGCIRRELSPAKLCNICNIIKPRTEFYNSKNYACKECVRPINNARKKGRDKQARTDAINNYGGKCACCGEANIEFLQIDHIHGGGNKHRQQLDKSGSAGSRIYYWLRKNNWPDGYQVLCANCNWSSAMFGYCPHTRF